MTHVVQTDHRILRTPSEETESDLTSSTGELTFFEGFGSPLSEAERQRALAAGTYIHHIQKKIPFPPDLQQDLHRALQNFPEDYLLLTIRGNVARYSNDLESARAFLEKACEVSDTHEEALDGLIEVYYQTADWENVVDCAEKLIEIDPTDTGTYAMLGDALANLGRTSEGIHAVEQAAELNPSALPLHEWLLSRYRRYGLTDLAEEKEKLIERIRSAQIPERIKPPSSLK